MADALFSAAPGSMFIGLDGRRADQIDTYEHADGFAAATLRAVAQRVGVAAMALYGYFPDKDSLLYAPRRPVAGLAHSEPGGGFNGKDSAPLCGRSSGSAQ